MGKLLAGLLLLLTLISCDYVQVIPVTDTLTPISKYNFTNSDRYDVEIIASGVNKVLFVTCDQIILNITDRETGEYNEYSFDVSDLKEAGSEGRFKIDKKSNEDSNVRARGILHWMSSTDLNSGTGLAINPKSGNVGIVTTTTLSSKSSFFGEITLIKNDKTLLKVKYRFDY